MARHFALRAYRQTITLANTSQRIFISALTTQGYQRFTESFRLFSDGGNTGVLAVGGPTVTVNTNQVTDGEPISAGSFTSAGVEPKVASVPTEIDLQEQYVVGTVAGDEFYVTYLGLVD